MGRVEGVRETSFGEGESDEAVRRLAGGWPRPMNGSRRAQEPAPVTVPRSAWETAPRPGK